MFKTMTALGLVLLAPAAQAQLTTTLETGYDNNPFRLSSQFDQRQSVFAEGTLRLEHDFGSGFEFDGNVSHLLSGADDGDQTRFTLTVSHDSETRFFGRPTDLTFHVRGTGVDRTFVSRSTGEVGVFGGEEIGSRFNQASLEGRARADIALNEDWTLRLQGDARVRRYEDYTDLGLSNLDYSQAFANVRLRYRPDLTQDLQIGGAIGHRVFEDRRGRALDTGAITGSDLEYSFARVDLSWLYDFTPQHDIRFAYTWNTREDNVTGYYDTTLNRYRVRYRYQPNRSRRFSAELEYRDFEFDNIPAALIVNEEENVSTSDGVRLNLAWEERLHRTEGREIWLETSIAYDDFDSPNQNFVYDRTVARAGIVIEFGG